MAKNDAYARNAEDGMPERLFCQRWLRKGVDCKSDWGKGVHSILDDETLHSWRFMEGHTRSNGNTSKREEVVT